MYVEGEHAVGIWYPAETLIGVDEKGNNDLVVVGSK
jgi:hypothetical protein